MGQTTIKQYDSMRAFVADCDTVTKPECKARRADEWHGHESWMDAKCNVARGNLDIVPRANALMDKLMGDNVELAQTVWQQSVAGYMPCVPAYLADQPECMFMPTATRSESAPVRVFASVCTSAGLDAEAMEKRGVTILALCMKMASIRPVELYVYADMGGDGYAKIPVIKVETSPLDLATATYALSSAAFLRHLCFSWAHGNGWDDGAWAWDAKPWSTEGEAKTRKAIGAGENDLLIIGAHMKDPLVSDPVAWLNTQMARYATEQETA